MDAQIGIPVWVDAAASSAGAHLRKVLAALGLILFATGLSATTLAIPADPMLVEQAAAVVRGRVIAVDPRAGAARPATRVTVEVVERVLGQVADQIQVTVPGGIRADGLGLRIFGAPRLAVGDRALLFLQRQPDGYGVLHLAAGVFRELQRDGRRLAVPDLAEVHLVSSSPPARIAARDLVRFVAWIKDQRAGADRAPDYFVDGPGPRHLQAPFTHLTGDSLGVPVRWFAFDGGGEVPWEIQAAGLDGQHADPPTGSTELELAIAAWNDDPGSAIAYRAAGAADRNAGFESFDGHNAVLFGDPNGEVSGSYSCGGSAGIIAVGGGWFDSSQIRMHRGEPHYEIIGADVVTNNGTQCLFGDSPAALEQVLTHELGHALGLGHSCEDREAGPCDTTAKAEAVMRAILRAPYRGAELGSDDRAGVRCLYGDGATCQATTTPPPVPDAPSELAASPLSATEVELTWRDNSNTEYEFRIEAKADDESRFREVQITPPNAEQGTIRLLRAGTAYRFRVRAGTASALSEYSNEARATTPAAACPDDPVVLCLHGGRFRAEVEWRIANGASGRGMVGPHDDGSGVFYFFAPDNWELMMKVLDACGLEPFRNYWVFLAAVTDVEFTLTVTDTATGVQKQYRNPLGHTALPVLDTAAFATCP